MYLLGSGGRDLKTGNKRTSNQEFDQTLDKSNRGIAISCDAPFNDEEGAEAKDWKKGKPIRVLRSYKFKKHSTYAPDIGVRYDGIYRVVKYYPEKGQAGFKVWKFLLRRDDASPAPWEEGAKKYECEMYGANDENHPPGKYDSKAQTSPPVGTSFNIASLTLIPKKFN